MTERILDNETRYTLLHRLGENRGCRSALVRDQARRACGNKASRRRVSRQIPITANAVSPTSGLLHKALLDKGYIKATNFKNSKNKRGYLYQLTPAGIAAKSRATKHFLVRKQAEYERLAQEIEQLQQEVQAHESA